MLFVIHYKPKKADFINTATELDMQAVGGHFSYLQGLFTQGKLKLAGRRVDGDFGIAVLEGVDFAEAERILQNDPVIIAGVFQGTVGEFKIPLERLSTN